jgi:hypothetical protein
MFFHRPDAISSRAMIEFSDQRRGFTGFSQVSV